MTVPTVAVPAGTIWPGPEVVMVRVWSLKKVLSKEASRGELRWMKFRKSSNVFPDPGAPNPSIKVLEYCSILISPRQQSEHPVLHRDCESDDAALASRVLGGDESNLILNGPLPCDLSVA